MKQSPSTIELLGDLHIHEQEVNHNELISATKLDIEVLVDVAAGLLKTVQRLRRLIRKCSYGRIGRELHHLSLTVASFERVLYTFITEEILEEAPQPDFHNETAIKDAVPLIDKQKSYPVLQGGMGSLLRHTATAFEDTCCLLDKLEGSYDPHIYQLWATAGIPMFIAGFYFLRKYLTLKSIWRLIQEKFLSRHPLRRVAMVLIALDLSKRLHYRFSYLRDIKICHSRILLTLRLFLLCERLLQRSRLNRSKSLTRYLIDYPCEADVDDSRKNATSLLVQRVPLPRDYYTRTPHGRQLGPFRLLCTTLCASSGAAYSVIGKNKYLWDKLWHVAMIMFIPYYLIRQNKAARYATRLVIDEPNIEVMRKAWSLLGDSSFSLFLHKLLFAPKLAVANEIFIDQRGKGAGTYRRGAADISVHLFSMRPVASIVAGTWAGAPTVLNKDLLQYGMPEERPVLFYIHGGGFFTRMFCCDYVNLSRWAKSIGCLIVYTDYDLAPESPYPEALNQVMAVYTWLVKGGLGFSPTRIIICGESAGGNMGTAMCFKIAKNPSLRSPDGLMLIHPALNCYLSPSPSRFLHQNDPVLPRGILQMALNCYYPSHGDESQYEENNYDPYVSPGAAAKDMLAKLPLTNILAGDLDPLLDDSVDFNTRIRQEGVPGSFVIVPGMAHGFLTGGQVIKEAQDAIDKVRDIVYDMFYKS